MLKTNSKQARQNVQAYIMAQFDECNIGIETPETFKETAAVIMDAFKTEKPAVGSYSRMTDEERFIDWAQGLPSILDLGAILEETETEKARYSESKAAELLTKLIYRELIRGCK